MLWFGGKLLDDQLKGLVVDLAEIYAKRAQLLTSLISLTPSISREELAAYWAVMAERIDEQDNREDPGTDSLRVITRSSFDTFCADYMQGVLRSKVELRLDSLQIREWIGPVFQSMNPDRGEIIAKLIAGLASNATEYAGAMMLVWQRGTSKRESLLAVGEVIKIVRSNPELNRFEKITTERWLNLDKSFWVLDPP